jgi:endonuclease G
VTSRLHLAERSQARKALADLLNRHFTASEFNQFLQANELGEVVDAIPDLRSSYDYVYELVLALDRRGRLDAELCADLAAATNEHDAIAEIVSGLGIQLQSTSPAPPAIDELIKLVRREPIDNPGTLASLVYGSPHYDQLRAGPEGESTSEAIARLAGSTDPHAVTALGWLAGHIYDSSADGQLTEAARAVMVMTGQGRDPEPPLAVSLPSGRDVIVPGPESMLPVRFLAAGAEAARGVVAVYGPQAFVCTGWLISPQLVIVPAHIFSRTVGSGLSDDESLTVQHSFDEPGAQTAGRVEVTPVLLDKRLDLALLRLPGPLPDVTPLQVRPDTAPGGESPISMIHHFNGGPKRISLHDGRLLRNDGHELVYLAATGPGTAGAPVFDGSWRVIGTHRAWRGLQVDGKTVRAKSGIATPALLDWLRVAGPPGGSLWREVVAAQPDLRTIDATLRHALKPTRDDPQPRAPMLIKTADPDHSLDGVPDLRVDSRIGNLVSATGTKRSLDRLDADPGVLAVDSSTPGGEPECWQSVPHVWGNPAQDLGLDTETGAGALVAIVDNGVDVLHQAFLDSAGRTRIAAFWDQKHPLASIQTALTAHTISASGQDAVRRYGVNYGTLYIREDIQAFVDRQQLPAHFPRRTDTMHGTRVASIAAGRRTGPDTQLHFGGGVAPESLIVVVRPDSAGKSIGYSKGHTDALSFIDHVANELQLPVVVNISAGMNLGAHDGTSDAEVACEKFLEFGTKEGRAVVKSAGNESDQARHAALDLPAGMQETLTWQTDLLPHGDKEATDQLVLWFSGDNTYTFELKAPDGSMSPAVDTSDRELASLREHLPNGNMLTMAYDGNRRESPSASLSVTISRGQAGAIQPGTWRLVVTTTQEVRAKEIHAWIERSADRQTGFIQFVRPDSTITIPGTAPHVITVGAVEVNQLMRTYPSSSRGPALGDRGCEKPVLVAPGVGIRAAHAGTAADLAPADDGTSYAAPHVTGAIAVVFAAHRRAGLPAPTSVQLERALKRTVKRVSRWNDATGFGQLDVRKLLTDWPGLGGQA